MLDNCDASHIMVYTFQQHKYVCCIQKISLLNAKSKTISIYTAEVNMWYGLQSVVIEWMNFKQIFQFNSEATDGITAQFY